MFEIKTTSLQDPELEAQIRGMRFSGLINWRALGATALGLVGLFVAWGALIWGYGLLAGVLELQWSGWNRPTTNLGGAVAVAMVFGGFAVAVAPIFLLTLGGLIGSLRTVE